MSPSKSRPGSAPGLVVALIAALIAGACAPNAVSDASGPLPHQAFVWQRQWTPELREAVRRAPALNLGGLVALGAEIEHRSEGPRVTRIPVDLRALRAAGPPGLALRIGGLDRAPYPQKAIAEVAGALTDGARSSGFPLTELQIDHDCPTRRLAECAELLDEVKIRIAPTPLTFTALPSWLDHGDDFERLLAAADGYVLQVHSLDEPGTQAALVDPERARRAVWKAARFKKPFRVALPTHAYVVHLDAAGRTVGVGAEDGGGASLTSRRRLVTSEPKAMAALVRGWEESRPTELQGLIWFRLPVPGDRFNWTSATLAAVLDARVPEPRLEIAIRRPRPGLAEIDLVNPGDAAETVPRRLELHSPSPPDAGDGLGGYQLLLDRGRLEAMSTAPLRPGERRTVAWLRFSDPDFSLDVHLGDADGL